MFIAPDGLFIVEFHAIIAVTAEHKAQQPARLSYY